MDLPTFKSGDRLTAQQLQRLSSAIQAATIQKGIGYTFERTSAGTRLRITPQEGSSGGSSVNLYSTVTPFQVVLGYTNPDAPEYPVVRVNGESWLSIIETGQIYPITGLGAVLGSEQDTPDDPNQFPLPDIGHSIWIELTVSGFAVTSASIWYGKAGEYGWENYPNPVAVAPIDETNPYPYVYAVRQVIAHVTYANDPRAGTVYQVGPQESAEYRKILQVLKTNLGVQVLMINGIPAPMLVPWHAPFQIE